MSLWFPDFTCDFVHVKQSAYHQNYYVVPMGPAVICGFCMQNSDFWTRITSLYGSQTSPVVMRIQNSVISIRMTSLYGSQLSSVAFVCKQSLLDQTYKSLWVPDPTCGFGMQKSDFWTRITSLYWSQTSPVILCMQNSVINNRITSL